MVGLRHSMKGRARFKVKDIKNAYRRALALEKTISQEKGIIGIQARAYSGSVIVFFNDDEITIKQLSQLLAESLITVIAQSALSYYETVVSKNSLAVSACAMKCDRCEPLKKTGSKKSILKSLIGLIGLTVFVVYTVIRKVIFKSPVAQGIFSLTSIVSLAASIPLFSHAISDMRHGRHKSLFPFLATSILLAIILGEALTALEVIWILRVGMLLEDHVAEQSRKAIREILKIAEKDTYIFVNGVEVRIRADAVQPGDTVVIHTGEKIPVDGVIIRGKAVIDESHITGRAEPEIRGKDDCVFAGTIVQRGVIYINAEKVGDDTYLCRILQLVEDSLDNRAPAEQQADVLAARLFKIGTLATVGTLIFTLNPFRAFTVMLVMACPCATVLAASTAISAAIANAAKNHILIKGGLYLEMVGKADSFCFDKTGTLTTDTPQIVEIIPFTPDKTENDVLELASIAEVHNEHPLAKAVMKEAAARGIETRAHVSCEFVLGLGVLAQINGDRLMVGNSKFMEKGGCDISLFADEGQKRIAAGQTLIYVAKNQTVEGVIAVENKLRPNALSVIEYLRKDGVKNLHLITGDTEPVAEHLAQFLGFDDFKAELLPEDKAAHMELLESNGCRVVMVGDGVNDALALSKSSVGIAMGAGGADVAIEAADIALTDSDLTRLITLRKLSRQTLKVIDQNYYMATSTNVFGMVFGAAGLLTPLMGGMLHIVHTLGILANSSRLLNWKDANINSKND
ncbi:MAG: cation-translocating P-type ATPase [Desulfamplus sp.]|nr:cation-translocating P-type ATPase [Desulfamplus sp.]